MSTLPLHRRLPGFTIIEMMVVMAIMGILFTLAAGGLVASQQKSRDARRKSDLAQIAIAIETYFNDKGEYPLSDQSFKLVTDGCTGGGAQQETIQCDWGSPLVDSKGTTYMVKLPEDPQSSFAYHYYSDGTYFQIYARLENTEDPSIEKINGNPSVYSGVVCGSSICNYGVSSPNATPLQDTSLVEEP